MIHGGYEYGREPSNNIQHLTTAAREAGAELVVNHHPHVTGGFNWDGSSLVAQTLGNFVFDQTVWPTFESYLLTVNLRRGQVVNAYAEPLMIEDYLPKGLTGELADYVARGAAGRESGPFLIEDGAAQVDINDIRSRRDVSIPLDGEPKAGSIYGLNKGSWVSDFSGDGNIRLGRDLLWVGSFEDDDIDAQNQEGALWNLGGQGKYLGSEYAYKGEVGAHLERENIDRDAVVLTPVHRILVEPGKKLSVVGMVRTGTNADLALQLSWYADTKGASAAQTYVPVNVESDSEWDPFRIDVTVPPNAVATGLYLRMEPPPHFGEVQRSTADLDNIRIIEWAPAGSAFSPLYDYFALVGSGETTLSRAFLPGAEEWTTLEKPQAVPQEEVVTPSVDAFPAATQQRVEE